MTTINTIESLPKFVSSLSSSERQVFDRVFLVNASTGEMDPPPAMHPMLVERFGSVQQAAKQTVIKVTNRVTLETSLFNPLRAVRPTPKGIRTFSDIIEEGKQNDAFIDLHNNTAADLFGRVQGEYCITASNLAKVDKWHSVVIYDEFHPHQFKCAQVIDYIMTAREWAEMAVEKDPKSPYFFFLWNCMNKAGASQIHGHAQAMLTSGLHYGKVEQLRRDTLAYQNQYKRNYFLDLVNVSRTLGLTVDPADRVKAVISLTPTREKEIWLITDDYSPELGEAIYNTLAFFFSQGVQAYNVAIQMPPLRPVSENWSGFPVIARLVSRGDPLTPQNDVGAIELFGANTIIGDPFKLAADYRAWLKK